jgi:hypothetical protein
LRTDLQGEFFDFGIRVTGFPQADGGLLELDPGHPIRQPAIYQLEGDTLKIASTAAGKPRPVDFVSRKGDFGGVWVLKRVAATATAKPVAK